MGCDIHFHTEVKINGNWEHYGSPAMPRKYSLFAKLADVRNRDNCHQPIAEPRGLPEDATFLTRFDADRWDVDGHSHSWISAEEIAEVEDWLASELGDDLWKLETKYWGYFFGNSWGGFYKYPKERPKGVEDVRFVFWFDN